MGKKLLIRADGGTQLGSGHVMRCLALAQAWQDTGGKAMFVMGMPAPALEARLKTEGVELLHISAEPGSVDDARQMAALAQRMEAPAVVVDGYHFDAAYQRIIKDSGLCMLFIDDYGHADYYWADIVLNQNIHAHEGLYANRAPSTRLLLGTRHVLLRREFLKWRGQRRQKPNVAHNLLVTLGGSDPANVTLTIIRALQQVNVDGLEVVVAVGGSNPHYDSLASAIQESPVPIRLECDVTDMTALMAWADMAIAAGGSTGWELAFLGVPALIVILAPNQWPAAEMLDARGVYICLGESTELSVAGIACVAAEVAGDLPRRKRMAEQGQALVDGRGASRVVELLMRQEK